MDLDALNKNFTKNFNLSAPLTLSLLSHPPDTTRFDFDKNPTDEIGASWTPICWGTLLGGVSPRRHIRTALSAPQEKTVDPSDEKHVSSTGDCLSWLTWALGWAWTGCWCLLGWPGLPRHEHPSPNWTIPKNLLPGTSSKKIFHRFRLAERCNPAGQLTWAFR